MYVSCSNKGTRRFYILKMPHVPGWEALGARVEVARVAVVLHAPQLAPRPHIPRDSFLDKVKLHQESVVFVQCS